MTNQRAVPAQQQPQQPWRQFMHYCRGCDRELLPYGQTCSCGHMTPLPVSRLPVQMRPWHQLATTTVMRIGRTYVAVDYDITTDGQVSIKSIRAKGRPALRVRPYYQKMIVHHIAKAEEVIQ